MGSVPSDRVLHADDRTLIAEYLPTWIGRFRPVPTPFAGVDRRLLPEGHPKAHLGLRPFNRVKVWDEIGGQPILMRALPWPRFRSFLGNQLDLPEGVAKSLEDLETNLRLTGLMGPGEGLMQSFYFPRKFRVKRLDVPYDLVASHCGPPVEAGAPPSGAQFPASMEVPSPSVAPAAGQGRRAERPLTREAAKAIGALKRPR